jgi:hypothetical protein
MGCESARTIAAMPLPQVTLHRFLRQSLGNISLVLLLLAAASAATTSAQSSSRTPFNASLPSIDFGTVSVGSSASQNETLTNVTQNTLTIYQTSTTGSGFASSGLIPPISLTAGQSYTFSVNFSPLSSGAVTGSLQVISRNGKTFSIPLTGTGATAGALSASPASEAFGNVTVGSSGILAGTLKATGASITISGATSTNAEFSISGITFPLTLSAGTSATFNVIFRPSTSGSTTGVLTFNSSANAASQSLSGTGVSAPQHSVNLFWDASTSVVNGYNVYRGTKTGGPYSKVNSSLDALTSYVDLSVVAGSSYYYVTTAVDSSGNESSYSNEVNAVIPTP